MPAKDVKTHAQINIAQTILSAISRVMFKKYLLLCFVWMCINVSCKKQAETVSPDHIELEFAILILNLLAPLTAS